MDAPPNPWADMKREEDARDLVLFTELVEKVGRADTILGVSPFESDCRPTTGKQPAGKEICSQC
jgi:hypothetical protein